MQCKGIGPHLSARGSLLVFLELQRDLGYILDLGRVAINTFCFIIAIRAPLKLRWTPQESKLGLAEQNRRFWR